MFDVDERLKIRAVAAPWSRRVDFLIRQGKSVGVNVTMQEVGEAVALEPTFSLDTDMAQNLMDDLWQCGLRPSEGTGSAGAMAATERHLKDMQRLVFEE